MEPLSLQIKSYWLLNLFILGITLAFLLFILRTRLGFLPVWDMLVVSFFFWLSLGVTLDLVNIFYTLFQDTSWVYRVKSSRNIYTVLATDKVFRRIE